MERGKGEGRVSTNASIGSLARERTRSISNKIESWIKLKMAGQHELGLGNLLLFALFIVCHWLRLHLEQLRRLQDLLHLVNHQRLLIDHSPRYLHRHDLCLQADDLVVILDGEIELVGLVGGQHVDEAVVGIEHLEGLVHGDVVVEQERSLLGCS
ncbi:hypothetical protein L3X38_009410 [Prunus dulcis]|uniref:Uncharacterized protein n=1 Tax=Prunus dulcis TaxID=3755 RepID=A0AAD4WDK5_PRUDU|nr:hypothetical protein L3X38_009410 [Prunus dulcis]